MARLSALASLGIVAMLLSRESPLTSSSVYINEVLLLNRFSNLDEDGNTAPWIELKNGGASPVDLKGFYLTNDATAPSKWALPSRSMEPGGYLLIWCSGKDRRLNDGEMHANFELSRGGETILLVGPDGSTADAVTLVPQTADRAYGRFPDGTGDFRYLLVPTPASSNRAPASQTAMPSRVHVLPEGGLYTERLEIELSIPLPVDGFEIRYTTDETVPHAGSLLYAGPIVFVPGTNKLLRAAAFYDNERVSAVATHSYFLDGIAATLPFLSIVMEPSTFVDLHLSVSDRGPASERAGHVEISERDGRRALGTGMGLRLQGFTGRYGNLETKKSYLMYFRDAYGNGKLRYALMEHDGIDGLDRVVLRGGNDDAFRRRESASYIRDQLVRERHALMGGLVSHGSWYNLFVNMEFRGVYNVVERIDGDFLTAHLGASALGWDIIRDDEASEGTLEAWQAMLDFVLSHDLADPAAYRAAQQWIELGAFTDYMILNIWAQNHDWPHKNFFAVRPRTPDGKFRFLSWDAEMSLGLHTRHSNLDTFTRTFIRGGSLSDLFGAFMQNTDYQELFVSRLEERLSGVLEPSALVSRIRELRADLEADLSREVWEGFSEAHVALWQRNMDALETFVRERPSAVRLHVQESSRMQVR